MKISIVKKLVASIATSCVFFTVTVNSQAQTNPFQLRNADFEDWTVAATGEPPGWNSFASANCEIGGILGGISCSAAKSTHHTRVNGGRTGSTGQYYFRIWSTATLGIVANGNITSGIIHVGSTTATDTSNYNNTRRSDSKYSQVFRGTPDSMYVWVKFHAASTSSLARISTLIHGNTDFKDPNDAGDPNNYKGKAILQFPPTNGQWELKKIPFVYDGNSTAEYIIVTFTTNATPGGGAANDSLCIDDIEFIYSAWLTDLRVKDTTIANFEKGILDYAGPTLLGQPPYAFPYNTNQITYTTEVNDVISVVVTNVNGSGGDADGGYTSVLVTAEDGVTTKEYKIHYFSNRSNNNNIDSLNYTLDGSTPIAVSGFTSSTLNHNVILTNPEEVRVPVIKEENIVLSNSNAEIYRIIQPTGVNSVGSITVRAENYEYKTYTVTFSKILSTNSKLSTLKVGGIDIDNFNSDTLAYNYDITNCVTAIPAITFTASSVWASVSLTQATMTNQTTTIKVRAENGDTTIYTINFIFKNNNTTLSGYRVASTNRNNSFTSTNNYTDAYSAAFTTVPALSASTTSGQQGCSAATVKWPVTDSVVFYPDTNYIVVTAQDGITTQTYKSVLKNTNCYLKQTSGSNVGLKYRYDGVVRNITIPSASNNNDVTVNVTIPVVGRNVAPELIEADPQAPVVDTIIYVQPAARAGNSGSVTVYPAHDNGTSKKYIINFTPTLSNDATLSSIAYNGLLLMGFAPATEHYTIILPSNVTAVPEITVTPNFPYLPDTNIVIIPAASLQDTTIVTVTAENGNVRTYSIDFELVEPEKDAYLSTLKYNNTVIPGFNPTIYDYTVDIPYSTTTPPVISAISTSGIANIFYSQPTTLSYTGTVLVYSEDKTVLKIYTVNFNLVKSIDAALSDIKVNNVSIDDFDPQVFTYNVELPYTDLNAPVVAATSAYTFAQVNITQIDTVIGTTTILVTAEDNAYTALYTIYFTRELSPIVDIDSIIYQYNNQTYGYKAPSHSGTAITIMLPMETEGVPNISDIIVADNRSDIAIEQQPVAINNFTSEGLVTVTAEDLTEETYEITFKRILSGSTLVKTVFYGGTPIPNFDPNTTSYNVILPLATAQAPAVSVGLDWKYTDTTIYQTNNPNGGQATINVISEDGQNHVTYTITFVRQGDVHLASLSYNLNGTIIPVPDFDPDILTYSINLPIATTTIPVLTYIANDPRTTQVTQNTLTTPNGIIQLTLITANGIPDTLTYTVNFHVIRSTEALLSDLLVDGVTIDDFQSNRLNYAMEVDYEYGVATLPEVTAIATQPDARVDITQINEYPGTALITVYAGDTAISRTYAISFTMNLGNNTYLSDLLIGEESLPKFNKEVYFYEIKLPYQTTQLPEVTATTEDARAIVTITQAAKIGDTAKITVTALNGDIALYQVFFEVGKNPNAYAKNIFIDWEPLKDFEPTTRNYNYHLPSDYKGIPFVVVELENPNATYDIVPPTTIPAQMQIIVTAENGENQIFYRINFARDLSIVSYDDNPTEINIYPNPTTGQLKIEISDVRQEIVTIEIYDVTGQMIQSKIVNLKSEIDVSYLANGMYFFKIFSDKIMLGTGRFVKN